MATTALLRARAQRFRALAETYDGVTAAHLREAAEQLERQADALDAYGATTRSNLPPTTALTA
jgi:hypothetical protein